MEPRFHGEQAEQERRAVQTGLGASGRAGLAVGRHRLPCERKRAAPEGASRVLPGGKTLPQAEFTSAEGEKWGPHGTQVPWGTSGTRTPSCPSGPWSFWTGRTGGRAAIKAAPTGTLGGPNAWGLPLWTSAPPGTRPQGRMPTSARCRGYSRSGPWGSDRNGRP